MDKLTSADSSVVNAYEAKYSRVLLHTSRQCAEQKLDGTGLLVACGHTFLLNIHFGGIQALGVNNCCCAELLEASIGQLHCTALLFCKLGTPLHETWCALTLSYMTCDHSHAPGLL